MLNRVFVSALIACAGMPALAEGFSRISDRSEFVQTVQDKELRLGMFGISLTVEEDGEIKGRALGWDVTGTWEWRDGYFCREMDWSGYPIPQNCQLVEARGGEEIRFTVDKGAGDSASFKLR
ncbi:dihydrodipicolinate reductase [Rhodobacter sp. CCP-1]|uniref:Dihydrodipicolinate reductase n=2 Tax=Paragemmobacter ruber TaxID=1985673 RepID=A0ABW9Y3R5_9RHOB|nr:dihydrodipicolinate reductase [Rhodobacter ruber]